jgi:hypothetical protein
MPSANMNCSLPALGVLPNIETVASAGRPCGVVAEAALTNFYTLWRYSKKFKFLKEVKFL